MSKINQQPDAQTHSQAILQDLQEYLLRHDFGDVLNNLPSYKEHEIFLDDSGDLLLQFGHVEGANDEALVLSIGGHTNWLHLRNKLEPLQNCKAKFVKENFPGNRAPFDWDEKLFEGLFREPAMEGTSRVLLDFYFLQWAVDAADGTHYSLPSSLFGDSERKHLLSALNTLRGTAGFQGYRSLHNTPTLSPLSSLHTPRESSNFLGTPLIASLAYSNSYNVSGSQQTQSSKNTRQSGRAVFSIADHLKELKEKIDHLAKLPGLEDMEFKPCEREGRLQMQLCIGHTPKGKIWMYIEKNSKSSQVLAELETVEDGSVKMQRIEIAKLESGELAGNDIILVEPLHSGKCGGLYMDPMINLAKYYFLLAYDRDRLSLEEDEISMNSKFIQYLKSGVNAYIAAKSRGNKRSAPSTQASSKSESYLRPGKKMDAERSEEIGDESEFSGNVESPEIPETTPEPSTPRTASKKPLITPASPPSHERGSS